MLADHVLGHVVDAIAGLDDISVDDGVVLESLCSTLLGALGDGSAHWFVHARMVTKEDLVTSSRDTGVTTLDRVCDRCCGVVVVRYVVQRSAYVHILG